MELTGLSGTAALAAPLLLLLVVMLGHAVVQRRHAAASVARGRIATGRYGTPVPGREPPAAPTATPATPPKAAPVPPRRAPSPAEIGAAIAAAEASRDERKLATLYTEMARHRIRSDEGGLAGEDLRKAIRIAARLGLREEHAAARLELGDLARASGDLTTACEHWQIARGLYFEAQKAAELEAAEKRMRDMGCPTDWVLNDF